MVRHPMERVGPGRRREHLSTPQSLISPGPFSCIPHLPFSLSSSALKIHLSSETKAVLEEFGGFELELRGDVEMKVEKEAPMVTIPWGPRGGCPPSSPFSSSHFHSHHLANGLATPHPNPLFCFPPGQRQSSDLLAAGGAGEQHPGLTRLPSWPPTPPFPAPEVTARVQAPPSPTADPLLPEDQKKGFEQLRCAHCSGDPTHHL